MKFYDRIEELEILKKNWEQSSDHSMMTTLIGRRRTGKTSLLLKSVEGTRFLYLYVSKDNEQVLCRKFQEQAYISLGLQIYGQMLSFAELFTELMRFGAEHHYTLIIDEFQNLLSVNKAIPSIMQDIWDRQKDSTRVNLILCGSIYSMMKKIFENGDEPLYGRRDSNMRLLPFTVATLKQILKDHNPEYAPEDLLCVRSEPRARSRRRPARLWRRDSNLERLGLAQSSFDDEQPEKGRSVRLRRFRFERRGTSSARRAVQPTQPFLYGNEAR